MRFIIFLIPLVVCVSAQLRINIGGAPLVNFRQSIGGSVKPNVQFRQSSGGVQYFFSYSISGSNWNQQHANALNQLIDALKECKGDWNCIHVQNWMSANSAIFSDVNWEDIKAGRSSGGINIQVKAVPFGDGNVQVVEGETFTFDDGYSQEQINQLTILIKLLEGCQFDWNCEKVQNWLTQYGTTFSGVDWNAIREGKSSGGITIKVTKTGSTTHRHIYFSFSGSENQNAELTILMKLLEKYNFDWNSDDIQNWFAQYGVHFSGINWNDIQSGKSSGGLNIQITQSGEGNNDLILELQRLIKSVNFDMSSSVIRQWFLKYSSRFPNLKWEQLISQDGHNIDWEAIFPQFKPRPTQFTPEPTPVRPQPTPIRPQPTPVRPTPAVFVPQPTPVRPTPTPVRPSPTPVRPTPALVRPTPAVVRPTPTPVRPTPAVVRPTPAVVRPTPTPVRPTPTPVRPTPAVVRPTPAVVRPTPTPVRPSPTPVRPTPAIFVPQPTPVRPTPALVRPTPTPVRPTPAVVRPTPAVVRPTPTPVRPTPAVVRPTPAVVRPTPTPVRPTPTPVRPTPAVFVPQPTPVRPSVTPAGPIRVQPQPDSDSGVNFKFTTFKQLKQLIALLREQNENWNSAEIQLWITKYGANFSSVDWKQVTINNGKGIDWGDLWAKANRFHFGSKYNFRFDSELIKALTECIRESQQLRDIVAKNGASIINLKRYLQQTVKRGSDSGSNLHLILKGFDGQDIDWEKLFLQLRQSGVFSQGTNIRIPGGCGFPGRVKFPSTSTSTSGTTTTTTVVRPAVQPQPAIVTGGQFGGAGRGTGGGVSTLEVKTGLSGRGSSGGSFGGGGRGSSQYFGAASSFGSRPGSAAPGSAAPGSAAPGNKQ